MRLDWRDWVPGQEPFLTIVQELAESFCGRQRLRFDSPAQRQYRKAVLGNRQGKLPRRMPAPSVGASQSEGEVFVVPISRPWIEQIEAPPVRYRINGGRHDRPDPHDLP